MIDVSHFYDAAANVGLTESCTWTPKNGDPVTGEVDYRANDQDIFDGLGQSTQTTIRFPTLLFQGIRKGDAVEVYGLSYEVRDAPRLLHDGSETLITLQKA